MDLDRSFSVILAMFAGIVGLAMVAILVSQRAQTAKVFQALATGGSQLIGTAISPVTGASVGGSGS